MTVFEVVCKLSAEVLASAPKYNRLWSSCGENMCVRQASPMSYGAADCDPGLMNRQCILLL